MSPTSTRPGAELEAAWQDWAVRCGVVAWEHMLTLGFYSCVYPPAAAPAQPSDA